MVIYKLTQTTWNGGAVGDFELPRTLGHYTTEAKAEAARDKHIADKGTRTGSDSDWTDSRDYRIDHVNVW